MATCASCGRDMPDDARFCSNCGTPTLARRAPSAPDGATNTSQSGPRPAPPKAPPGTVVPPITSRSVVSAVQFVIDVMTAPGPAFQRVLSSQWSWISLVLPVMTFSMLFSQTLSETMTNRLLGYLLGFFIGGFFGLVIVGGVAVLAHGVSIALGNRGSIRQTITVVCGGFGAGVVYSGLGLMAGMGLGWNTSATFGMTGLLWTLVPVITGFRTAQMNPFAALFTGVISVMLVILAWVAVAALLARFG